MTFSEAYQQLKSLVDSYEQTRGTAWCLSVEAFRYSATSERTKYRFWLSPIEPHGAEVTSNSLDSLLPLARDMLYRHFGEPTPIDDVLQDVDPEKIEAMP